MITFVLQGDREVFAQLGENSDEARFGIARTVTRLGLETELLTKQKLSGQVLRVRTGLLRASINSRVTEGASQVTATIGTNVKYAGIHEFGGKIHVPEIRPVKARALAFRVGGKTVFAMSARAHDVRIPERSFLRSALREMQPKIKAELQATVNEAMRR